MYCPYGIAVPAELKEASNPCIACPGSGIDRVSNGYTFVLGNALETHDENAILGAYISAEVDFFYGFFTETA